MSEDEDQNRPDASSKSDPDCTWIERRRRIALTSERVKALRDEYERTGVGIRKLFADAYETPEWLDVSTISGWIDGRTDTAERAHYNFVLHRWQAFPGKAMVTITPAMRDGLERELSRTGFAVETLFRKLPSRPIPPSGSTIRSWRSGRSITTKQDYWTIVLEMLSQLPSQEPPVSRERVGRRSTERGRRRRGQPRDVLDLFE